MRKSYLLITMAMAASACTSPMEPTPIAPAAAIISSHEGGAASTAVTTERLRLRRADGSDIVTGLVNGQVITVPVNEKLDIWAEVRRLETDRARLVVDWGNGNSDFSGCGACKLENTYDREGRYAVSARVVDLNAPAGADPITSITVTLVAAKPDLKCDAVSTNFDSPALGTSVPFASGGITFAADVFGRVELYVGMGEYLPFLGGGHLRTRQTTTLSFNSDKNFFSVDMLIVTGESATYQALDGSGKVVASGPVGSFAVNPFNAGISQTTLTVTGSPFRSVVIRNTNLDFFLDNVKADCR